jgi:large subunit ribosomal protein L5
MSDEPKEDVVGEAPAEEPVAEAPAEETQEEPTPDEAPVEEPVAEAPAEGTQEKPAPEEAPVEEPVVETPAVEDAPAGEAAPGTDELPIIDAHAQYADEGPAEEAKAEPAPKRVPRVKKVRVPEEPPVPVAPPVVLEYDNPMQEIIVDKVVVNLGVGEAGEKIVRAKTLLERLTGQVPHETISRTTNRDLGIRKGQPIGCMVTLRGDRAEEFLVKALWVKDNKLPSYCFDPEGNCSFGIPDYTEFQDMKYDPDIGIFGMDISTVFKRKGGYRIKHRKLMKRRLPHRHRITVPEGKDFMRSRFNVEILEVS